MAMEGRPQPNLSSDKAFGLLRLAKLTGRGTTPPAPLCTLVSKYWSGVVTIAQANHRLASSLTKPSVLAPTVLSISSTNFGTLSMIRIISAIRFAPNSIHFFAA
jgi:hypothetical protein